MGVQVFADLTTIKAELLNYLELTNAHICKHLKICVNLRISLPQAATRKSVN